MFHYNNIQKLNDLEIGIYKYVLANKEKVPYMTIRELSNEVHVSTTSTLRFCRKLDCEGYSEFCEKLKTYQAELRIKEPQSDLEEVLHYFNGTYTSAFEEEMERAAELIRSAKKVIFAGMGSSGVLGRYGARYFSNMGKFSWSIEDPYYPVLKDMDEETIIIALSVSGESQTLIDLLQRFQKHRCQLLSITNEPTSTIAKMADWNISYRMTPRKVEPMYNVTTQVPVIFLIEALARRI